MQEQLSKGAAVLHNVVNAPHRSGNVVFFDPAKVRRGTSPAPETFDKTPKWSSYWMGPEALDSSTAALKLAREHCMQQVMLDRVPAGQLASFEVGTLRQAAKKYSTVSKGIDRWLAGELHMLRDTLLQPILKPSINAP